MFSLNSLTENVTNFKSYEEKILEISKKVGSLTMQEQFEEIDYQIFKSINKKIFRDKGVRRLDIKTLLAEVEIYRHVYIINEEELEKIENKKDIVYILAKERLNKGKKTIYFLDELINLKGYGKFSCGVVDLMIEYIKGNSYRKTAQIINRITGLSISGSAVWNVIQLIGNKLKEKEKYEYDEYLKGNIKYENKDNNIVFYETDGVFFTLQGKDRQEKIEEYKISHPNEEVPKSVRKKEIKVASVYEGFEKVSKGRNEVINKKVYAQAIDKLNIKDIIDKYIEIRYDPLNLKMIIVNSDGGTWTRGKSEGKIIYQIDEFHIKQMITRNISDKCNINKMIELYKNEEYLEMIDFCEKLKYNCNGEISEIDKLEVLKKYIKRNYKNFSRYQNSELFKKEKQQGNWYKNPGIQESTNYQVITSRMKRRRMSFSVKGADNLCRVLAVSSSYDYVDIENELKVQLVPEKIANISEDEKEYKRLLKIKYKLRKAKACKYNESFRGDIPGIEYVRTEEFMNIRKLIS